VLDNSINMSGVVRANSVGVRNGKIVLFGGKRGRVNVSGKIRARGKRRGQRGGRVHITGRKVAVPIAKIDVTGKAGGGEVLIGGAYKGGKLTGDSSIGYLQSGDLVSILTGANAGAAGNGYIPTAEGVYVGQDAVIDVSATEAGNGGRAILWADGTTIFNGTIRARGGDLSGDGGFVETSGAGRLGVGATASVDALAPNGRVGDWLLDPLSVTVATGGTATLAEIADGTDVANALTVDPTTLNNAMANVSIVATDFITFTDAVTMVNAGVGLTAAAGNLITVNAALSTNNGDFTFNADDIALNATVNAGTGTVTLAPVSAGRLINLGTETAGSLSLTDAELDQVTTGILRIGNTTSGNISFTSTINPANTSTLSLQTSGGVRDSHVGNDITIANLAVRTGNGIGLSSNPLETRVGNLAFSNIGGAVALSSGRNLTITSVDGLAASSNTGTTTFIGGSNTLTFATDTASTGNASYGGTTITVDDGPADSGVIVSSGGSLSLSAATVNLDGNLTATGGVSGNATTVNVLGSAPPAGRRAELQDAVDVASAGATINVAAGSYARFTIDKANLTIDGAGATTIVNAASPAITITVNGATVQNMLLQGIGAVDDVGILLDGTTTPGLTGITITNVDFSNLDDGIRSQGNIGDGVAANVDVTIAGNSNIDRAIFSDFLDAAIDVGDTIGNDAVYVVRDIVIQDGNDNDTISAVDGIRFGSIGGATVQGTMISAVSDDGIDFNDTLTNATVLIGGLPTMPATGNNISASRTGIETAMIDGGNFDVAGNTIVGDSGGIDFGRILNSASVEIAGNSLIQGGFDGIVFRDIDTSTVAVAGNTRITGTSFTGIALFGTINDSNVTVGPANVTVGTTPTAFGANTITGGDIGIAHIEGGVIAGTSIVTYAGNDIRGGFNGIFFDRIIDSAQVNIIDNTDITGTSDTGILFSQQIEGSAGVAISGNPITGGENGILFRDFINTASAAGIQINNNSRITGTNGDGISFEGSVTETIVGLNGNSGINGAVNGVFFADVSGTDVTVNGSTITGGMTGFDIFGAPNPGNRNRLSIANSAINGTNGAGLHVTTFSGGNGFTTNLGGGVSLTGAPALALSGPDQSLAGDTLNDTRFNGINGANFVELQDGALFEPGRPTLIDGRNAFYDGVPVPDMSPPALIQAVEERLVDFDDDVTLGQIFFTPFVPGPIEIETALPIPVMISTGPNLDFLIGQFNFILETGVRLINPQTPGDWILRPDYLFDILFGDLLAMTYPLGTCTPVFGDDGALIRISCIEPDQGSDVSTLVAEFMADLP